MQTDGNLVIYKGTSPNDNQGGVWNSGVTESGGFFYTAIRDDGTLAVFKGHDLNNDQNMIWNSGRFHLKQDDYLLLGGMLISPNKGFFATLLSSGELIVCRGGGLNTIERKVWRLEHNKQHGGRCYLYLQG